MDGHLPYPTRYIFEPKDNLAIGDASYAAHEMAYCQTWWTPLRYYWMALNYTYRNPAYGWDYLAGFDISESAQTTIAGNPNIDIGLQATFGQVTRTVTQNGRTYFDWKECGDYGDGYGWMLRFGWAINKFDVGYHANLQIDIRPRIKLP